MVPNLCGKRTSKHKHYETLARELSQSPRQRFCDCSRVSAMLSLCAASVYRHAQQCAHPSSCSGSLVLAGTQVLSESMPFMLTASFKSGFLVTWLLLSTARSCHPICVANGMAVAASADLLFQTLGVPGRMGRVCTRLWQAVVETLA